MSADGHELHNIVQRLQRADAFPHPSSQFEVIETHISLVLLTGDFAYKLKKPVDLGFLDFSTEEKREHYCHEEVRLNRRLAPEIYLGVVAITQGKNGPEVGGKGPTIWHAVKMRQFKRDHELDVLVPRGGLTRTHVDLLAIDIARFHQHCERSAEDSQYGTPETVSSHILECFELSEPCVRREQRARLSMLQDWCVEALRNSSGALQERKLEGYVREGHGDLHLRNMVLLEDRVVPFDCLEFNPELRWIDVLNDVAFLLMDLDYHGHHDLAAAFLNGYLEHTGDYGGLGLLRLYQVYRAMVRTKVACIREVQELRSGEPVAAEVDELRRHLELAQAYLDRPTPRLLITCGLSGSGKSTVAGQLLGPLGAIRIRSDVERKRLAGIGPEEKSGNAGIDAGLYAPAMTERTYRRLLELADSTLANGWSVIVDAAFLRRSERDQFQELARRRAIPFTILYCKAPLAVLRERVLRRADTGGDVSEATADVLQHQTEFADLPDADESDRVITIDTRRDLDIENIVARLAFP